KEIEDKRPLERYRNETMRLLRVLEGRLKPRQWMMGDEYTIADISLLGWVRNLIGFYGARDLVEFDKFKHVAAWLERGLARLVLGQIIGVLGLMLFALSAAGLYSAVERNDAARRVASLAGIDQQLFATLIGFRIERGTTVPALISATPADGADDTRIADNRQVSENGYRAAVERLAGTAEPGLGPSVAKFIAAHEALAVDRTKADAAMRQPKPSRDP